MQIELCRFIAYLLLIAKCIPVRIDDSKECRMISQLVVAADDYDDSLAIIV